MSLDEQIKMLYSRIRVNEKETARLEDMLYGGKCSKEDKPMIKCLIGALNKAHNRMGWELVDLIKQRDAGKNNKNKKSRNG